ncbi:MAG: GH39 family glycosyl hydrolase, partial [Cyclobacteriaceae bacterium]
SSPKLLNYIEKKRVAGIKEVSFVIIGKYTADDISVWMHGKYWGYLNIECYYKQTNDIEVVLHPDAGCYNEDTLMVTLSSKSWGNIYYTLDGTIPGLNSLQYTKPIKITANTELIAFAAKDNKKSLYYKNFYAVNPPGEYTVSINTTHETGLLKNFWNATGFSPAEMLLQPDMQQACDYMGAVPNKGLVFVRPHYFLNLLAVEDIESPSPVYNWSRMDSAMDVLIRNGLKPIFEIMGTPSSNLNKFSSGFDENYQAQVESHETFFTDFLQREKIEAWKQMVKDLVLHFIERYGLEEVRSWYFESVNEPDYNSFWKYSEQEFLNYYDACSEALLEVDPMIRFGGPGTAGGLKSKYLKLLLAHCDTGTNYFTGKKGSRIDFISIHVKDDPAEMVEQELEVIQYIRDHHPRFSDLPFVNDEADPISGWRRDYWWRPTPWHAAFIAQSVDLHHKRIIEDEHVKYAILSNDNAFIGNWLHRTQFAKFSKEGEKGFSFVKKPAFTVFTMMSLLGNTVLQSRVPEHLPKNIGTLATRHQDGRISLCIYNTTQIDIPVMGKREKENILLDCGDENIALHVINLPADEYILVKYRIDKNSGNPYETWKEMGAPLIPSNAQISKLRADQEIVIERVPGSHKVVNGSFKQSINLPASSVYLYMLVPNGIIPDPPLVKGVWINKYKNLHGGTDLMVRWKEPESSQVLTYEIWFSEDNKDFKKINQANFLDNGYLFTPGRDTRDGYLKIRAIDYWSNHGPFSETIYFAL